MSVAQGDGAVDGAVVHADAVSVETTWADPINESSVVAAGNVTALAANESATVWLEYRRDGASTWQSTSRQTVDSVGDFREVFTGLVSGASYEYRARAEAGNDTVSGSTGTFEVPDNPPTVKAGAVRDVGERSANLTASVGWLGGADSAEVYFVVSPVDSETAFPTERQTVTGDGPVSHVTGQLEPNTTYESTVHVEASDGDDATGEPVRFTTAAAFAVETHGVAAVNATALKASGAVTDFGGAESADVGFEYRRAGANEWTAAGWTTVTGTEAVSATLTGLSPNTTYEVRAVGAAIDNDRDIGETLTVTTDAAADPDTDPAVTATGATDVTQHTANVTASVADLGGADSAEVAFQLRGGFADDWFTFETRTVSGPADLTATFRDFQANTTYEYRAVLTASDGDNATGEPVRFTTDEAFAVRTDGASAVNASAVTVDGSVTNFADAKTADAVVQYREAGSLSWTSGARTSVSPAGTFEGTVTGLDAETDYEFRIRAVAGDGDEDYGGVVEATTEADPEPVVTTDASDVTEHTARLTASVTDLGGADSADVTVQARPVGAERWWTVETRTVTAPAAVNGTFRDFQANTTYEYRTTLTASDGDDATSGVGTLTTDTAFAVKTDSARAGDDTTVDVTGSVADLGGAGGATATVEYRVAGADEWTTAERAKLGAAGEVDVTITGLDPGTEYEVRVGATATDGDSDTGRVLSVRTDAPLAVATTGATDVTASSATLTGNLTGFGGAESASVAFEYRAEGADEWRTAAAENRSAAGEFSRTLTGLDAGTTYEVRAVADATDGDSVEGQTQSVTTERDGSAPTIDSFELWEFYSQNKHLPFLAYWEVSDDDSDLDSATVEVLNSDGEVVDSRTTTLGGGDDGGASYFRLKHADGEEYTVRLTVTDESGKTTTDTRTISG